MPKWEEIVLCTIRRSFLPRLVGASGAVGVATIAAALASASAIWA
jgi:hypothetical protein